MTYTNTAERIEEQTRMRFLGRLGTVEYFISPANGDVHYRDGPFDFINAKKYLTEKMFFKLVTEPTHANNFTWTDIGSDWLKGMKHQLGQLL